MPNCKEMYLKLFNATEQVISSLIAAQQKCEELYLEHPEPELKIVSLPIENKRSMDEE